jgi:sugar/nucleoside kinase (ribokinase family)
MAQIDFLAIGDIATNSFIRLKDASVNCDIRHEHCQVCLDFGEKVPYDFVERSAAAGNGPNAAVAARRLGLNVAIVTDIGDDEGGLACIETFKKEGVNADYITRHTGKPTNHHYVLWYEDERTILVKHEEYEYKLPDFPPPSWLYLSSIGANSEKYHAEVAEYLEKHPEIKVAFQPGTFQIKDGYDKMKYFYERADIFAVNASEARRILKTETEEADVKELLEKIRALGPKTVVITDGKNGVYLFDGKESWHVPIYPDPKAPYERTGAGDALTSTFISGIILGKDPLEALKLGLVNASSVVQQIGPQRGLLGREVLENKIAKAPPEFAADKI